MEPEAGAEKHSAGEEKMEQKEEEKEEKSGWSYKYQTIDYL